MVGRPRIIREISGIVAGNWKSSNPLLILRRRFGSASQDASFAYLERRTSFPEPRWASVSQPLAQRDRYASFVSKCSSGAVMLPRPTSKEAGYPRALYRSL